jgi:glycosyltransferase involved in cell wall biosynthesis
VRPLRIAHLLGSAVAGGAERQELALAERLPRDRFRIEFLVIGGTLDYRDRLLATGVRAHFLRAPAPPNETMLHGMRRRAGMASRFVPTVRRGRYDIIDAWLYPADVLAALTRHLTGTAVVMSGRRNIHPHDRFGPLVGPLDSIVARLTDAVVANSEPAAANAIQAHRTDPAKLRIIRNGVEPIEPLQPPERARWRRAMGVDDDSLVIGCVGNYRSVKRHELLINAFAIIAPDHPDVRLVLVGEGETRAALEQQVARLGLQQRVRLHGSEADARPLYGAFDIVAQASHSEGLPNAMLEAASAGRAIVATAAGGTVEVVTDGETGLLVPVDEVGSLAAALRRVVEDSDLRDRLGREASQRTRERFGMERFVREYGDLYEELALAHGVERAGAA